MATRQNAAVVLARRNLQRLGSCSGRLSTDVNFLMLEAANLRILGRRDEAMASYRNALLYDQRPELYLNLGLLQMENGQTAAAKESILKACMFDPSLTTYEIPISPLRDEVIAIIREREERIRQSRSPAQASHD